MGFYIGWSAMDNFQRKVYLDHPYIRTVSKRFSRTNTKKSYTFT